MREILFRGKDSKGLWHIGLLAHINDYWWISNGEGIYTDFTAFDAIPETIGQYTGLVDKNGIKIFEGDILECESIYAIEYMIVFFDQGEFRLIPRSRYKYREFCRYKRLYDFGKSDELRVKVLNNIYDNPEAIL